MSEGTEVRGWSTGKAGCGWIHRGEDATSEEQGWEQGPGQTTRGRSRLYPAGGGGAGPASLGGRRLDEDSEARAGGGAGEGYRRSPQVRAAGTCGQWQ